MNFLGHFYINIPQKLLLQLFSLKKASGLSLNTATMPVTYAGPLLTANSSTITVKAVVLNLVLSGIPDSPYLSSECQPQILNMDMMKINVSLENERAGSS